MLGNDGLMKERKIKLMERMLGAELTALLGYEDGKDAPSPQAQALKDQYGSFEPYLISRITDAVLETRGSGHPHPHRRRRRPQGLA